MDSNTILLTLLASCNVFLLVVYVAMRLVCAYSDKKYN